jgi:transcriptional regulator GlxA family with amidase domain
MAEEPARDWSVPELAARCGLGPSRFHDRFRAAVGTTPHDHLARLRIERARALAEDPALTLDVLARAVGFSTPQSLARAIRRRTGAPAMAWLRGGSAQG